NPESRLVPVQRPPASRDSTSWYTLLAAPHGDHTVTTNLTQIRRERLAYEQERQEKLNVLTAEARQKIADAHLEIGVNWEDADGEENNATISRAYDGDSDVSDELNQADGRHGGRAIDAAQREAFESYYRPGGASHRRGERSRLYRNRAVHSEWEAQAQAQALVSAYLRWKHYKYNQSLTPMQSEQAASHIFQVTIVDLKEYDILRGIPQDPNELANVTLLHAGLLGSSPNYPSVAITLDCLEFYHQVCRRQPGFSVQAMCKVLCAIHNVTYSPTFRVQLSDTFDVYLDLLRRVRELTNKKLGWDGPNWRLLNACPPCSYKLEDEPALVPA
ncbi:hypothetical protein JB92DRAFT_3166372, partial [Gautieria morchelliformis]